MTSPASLPPAQGNDDHWKFLRDVLVFQLKMLLDNVRDFALMPVSLVAALIDLIFKGKGQGALFYQVLKWGAHSERVIDVYSAIEQHEKPGVNPNYTVDAVIARLEGVLVREVEKGGTAASVKTAMDRAIDQIQVETSGPRDAVARATNKLRSKFDREPRDERLRSLGQQRHGIAFAHHPFDQNGGIDAGHSLMSSAPLSLAPPALFPRSQGRE